MKDELVKINELEIIKANGEINFDSLNLLTDKVFDRSIKISSLSETEEQGRIKGGRKNVEASLLIAANNIQNVKQENAEFQENLLTLYANERGIWIDSNQFKTPINGGDEAKVYPSPNIGYIQKVFVYRRFSKTPLDFLTNRISLHNYIFPDTYYTLQGFTTAENFAGEQVFAFVVEQPFVQGCYIKSSDRITLLIPEMKKRGFDYKMENLKPVFYNNRYVIKDLHARNILLTSESNLRFIDTVPELNSL